MDAITSAREAVKAALADMEAALEAVQNPQPGADIDALERSFDEAEKRHADAVRAHERASKVAEARAAAPIAVEEPVEAPVVEERELPRVEITRDEPTYHKGNIRERSYFRDLLLWQRDQDPSATERISRHGTEVRTVTSTATTGGADAFVPPVYLTDDYAMFVRGQKITANLIGEAELPAGTDSITWPQVTTGTTEAAQDGQLGTFSNTDFIATPVSASVFTIGGTQSISLQALEQSPLAGGLDQFIYRDLAAAHAAALDQYVINGSGSSGQPTGLLNVSSINAVTYTTSTPTAAGIYSAIQNAISQVHTNRLAPATAIVMHPRRWSWLVAQADSTGRPLVAPVSPYNNMGDFGQASEGAVGSMAGLPVYLDANVPTTLSSTQDAIIVFRETDQRLFSSPVRLEGFRAAGITTGYVTFRLYNYGLFFGGLYPKATSKITGTGLTTPSF